MEARQVIAHTVGVAGCASIAYGMRGVMSFGCTDTAASCTADVSRTLPFLIGGIIVTVFSILAGAELLFPLLFLSIGVGSVVAGLQQGELFPIIFGVVFAAMATIPFIVMTKLRSFLGGGGPVRGGGLALSGLSSRKGVNDLLENGVPAVATILSIHETGTWIDDDPQVTLRARLEPVDGNPYEAEKTLVMSLVNPIRLGARIPALIYPENHAMFGLIVDITDPSKVPPRLRTLVDELSALASRQRPGAPGDRRRGAFQVMEPSDCQCSDERYALIADLWSLHRPRAPLNPRITLSGSTASCPALGSCGSRPPPGTAWRRAASAPRSAGDVDLQDRL